ncbi:hypothetical protein ELI_2458 [Eubacterium callanderi]|uniref:Uncharacterized protein n=1 Tax=Eubacterium callanderi TaxID=53442 RepID=E3GN63_9FIRM|nr:hypothetical protein ELI_2458 [Eubacterium callanderi]
MINTFTLSESLKIHTTIYQVSIAFIITLDYNFTQWLFTLSGG